MRRGIDPDEVYAYLHRVAAGTMVSEEEAQFVHHWVFCDRRNAGGRCPRLADHDGPCHASGRRARPGRR
ncbi:hypothetical protein QQG74_28560 [Micromonospora sp. FIMYZ51]|uniref:hypothetical protein n=1 Tax=Micromonospora sp. FIMYZ51 TaxID=3051832 RepID=UPI00311EE52D